MSGLRKLAGLGRRMDQAHEEALALGWANVERLKAITDQTEGTMNGRDWNGHLAERPDPEVRRITAAVIKLEALGYSWDAERCVWTAPGEDE